METNEELINEAAKHEERECSQGCELDVHPNLCAWCSDEWPCLVVRLADALEAATTEPDWQYSYVEKWADGSGVYERVTFKAEGESLEYLAANVASVSGFNSEQEGHGDRLVALVERRQVVAPGAWLPVEGKSKP